MALIDTGFKETPVERMSGVYSPAFESRNEGIMKVNLQKSTIAASFFHSCSLSFCAAPFLLTSSLPSLSVTFSTVSAFSLPRA